MLKHALRKDEASHPKPKNKNAGKRMFPAFSIFAVLIAG